MKMFSLMWKFCKSVNQKSKRCLRKPRTENNSIDVEKVCSDGFSQQCSIHGLRFLSGEQNGKLTRVFWASFLILSLVGLSYNTRRLYNKLNYEPDIGISESYELSRHVPFPAITICLPLFARDGLANFTHYLESYRQNNNRNVLNLTESEKKYLVANAMRCRLHAVESLDDCCKDTKIPNIIELINNSCSETDEAFISCSANYTLKECHQYLARTLTSSGLCFTANMQDSDLIFKRHALSEDYQNFFGAPKDTSSHWTLDDGYTNPPEIDLIPRRLNRLNYHSIRIKTSAEDAKNLCKDRNIIIKLHLPNEIATTYNREIPLELGNEKILLLNAKVTRAHDSLRRYSPDARKCYFDGERQLKFFKAYTKNHCQLECHTDFVLENCGCVGFFMPRNSSTKTCDMDKANCLHYGIQDWPPEDDEKYGTTPCDCYPTCNDIEYSVIESDSKYDASLHSDWIKNYSESLTYSRLLIHFKSHIIPSQEKFIGYTLQHFIADFGGLLGLFLGCSLLSMIEVFYFLFSTVKEKCKNRNVEPNTRVEVIQPRPGDEDFFEELQQIGDSLYFVRTQHSGREDIEDLRL